MTELIQPTGPAGGRAEPRPPSDRPWPGTWVASRLGVRLTDGERPAGAGLRDLVGLAVRRNPRRAHLLVSTVLGKHVPTDPRLVYGSGLLLGLLVRTALTAEPEGPGRGSVSGSVSGSGVVAPPAVRRSFIEALTAQGSGGEGTVDAVATAQAAQAARAAGFRDEVRAALEAFPRPAEAVVVGYAETATGLGHAVADALGGACYLHSTRRAVSGIEPYGGFEEEHSHATSHLLLPVPAVELDRDLPLVLVDDELSTGATVVNTLRALHAARARAHYVVAALVDLRSAADRDRLDALATELGARIDVVALAAGRVELPDDILRLGGDLVAAMEPGSSRPEGSGAGHAGPAVAAPVRRLDPGWPAGLPDGGRHGFTPAHRDRFERALPAMAGTLAAAVAGNGHRVLVLGCEELMYVPLRLAEALADRTAQRVRFSTTTRSPVLAVDVPGYAIRTRLEFPAHDGPSDGPGPRYAYNVAAGGGHDRGAGTEPDAEPDAGFDCVVLVVDAQADTPELAAGLLRRLTGLGCTVFLVTVPSYRPALPRLPEPLYGPAFGSYRAADVAWLLKDLSAVRLEAPTEEREAAVQSGRAHYAESLPQEYQPSEGYQRLFHAALAASADRLARAVAAITEAVLAERGDQAVLVSLARAGTPIGVLMRRWAAHAHGLDLPHYAVSIVRGRGIDGTALRYLAAHHDPARVMFVDGWTGKGAITRELTAALDAHAGATGVRFPADLAVLADPGRCVRIFGTREDFLIPSACLNSTVSGLVSRTVLNADLIGPGDFHGAKFYAELAAADVSELFLDTVCERFGAISPAELRTTTAAGPARPARPGGPPGPSEPSRRSESPEPPEPADWSGWAAVTRIGAAYGIGDPNLIKPGVGETTRVLLRRVPWKVLVRPEAGDDLAHVRLLAAERGVPVVEVAPGTGPDIGPYACVGLIRPKGAR